MLEIARNGRNTLNDRSTERFKDPELITRGTYADTTITKSNIFHESLK